MRKITLAAQGHGNRYKGIKVKGGKSCAVEITGGGRRPENIFRKYSSGECSGAARFLIATFNETQSFRFGYK